MWRKLCWKFIIWIDDYNKLAPHKGLKMMSPREFILYELELAVWFFGVSPATTQVKQDNLFLNSHWQPCKMDDDLKYKHIKPDKSLADFVESFWLLQNLSDSGKQIIVLPDGRIDLIFTQSAKEPFRLCFRNWNATQTSDCYTKDGNICYKFQTACYRISFSKQYRHLVG